MDAILQTVARYYGERLAAHGPTPQGVDWSSAESQALRFQQLLRLCESRLRFTLNDYGCGYGALAAYLARAGIPASYCGFDIAPAMLAQARRQPCALPACHFVSDEAALPVADYTVASGIFNVRLHIPDGEWEAYMHHIVARLAALSTRGFAFNALSRYTPPAERHPRLYYADPLAWFDHCKRYISPYVTLLHAYPLPEFTLLISL